MLAGVEPRVMYQRQQKRVTAPVVGPKAMQLHQRGPLILSRSWRDALNLRISFAATDTATPFFGFRPMRACRGLVKKLPNPLSSTL